MNISTILAPKFIELGEQTHNVFDFQKVLNN